MLFLLKRNWPTALAALAVLTLLGLGVRSLLNKPTPYAFSLQSVMLGVAVVGMVLASDVTLHGLFLGCFGETYRRRHRELAAEFRGQSLAAIVAGALMAGLGEELVFRGLGTSLVYLISGAIVFGGLHHIRRDLWPFTLWAMWQGFLFAAAIYLTEALCVTMVAHFLHDFTGFLIFRYLIRKN
jgi:membrane protease YdiL (CAAX protease family)